MEEQLVYENQDILYQEWNGNAIGEHIGAHFFTIGQRKGLKVGGHKEPLFVISTDTTNNLIYVGEGNHHPGLFKKSLFISNEEAHFIREDLQLKIGEKLDVESRIRYRQALIKSTLYRFEKGYYLQFEKKISAITKGQFAACYLSSELIFSGVIN